MNNNVFDSRFSNLEISPSTSFIFLMVCLLVHRILTFTLPARNKYIFMATYVRSQRSASCKSAISQHSWQSSSSASHAVRHPPGQRNWWKDWEIPTEDAIRPGTTCPKLYKHNSITYLFIVVCIAVFLLLKEDVCISKLDNNDSKILVYIHIFMVALRAYCRCLEALIIDVTVDQEMNCILTLIVFV